MIIRPNQLLLSMAAVCVAALAAKAEPPCCGGGDDDPSRAEIQLRLNNATLKAMGQPEIQPKSESEVIGLEKESSAFSQKAAKFALEQSSDETNAIQLFRAMIEQRALADVPPQQRARITFMAPNPVFSLAAAPEMITPQQILEDPTFVASANKLLKSIAEGQTPFVIGGAPDVQDQFSNCVAIGNEDRFFCTGTLIHPRLVVTAQHCEASDITRIFIGRQVAPTLSPDGHSYKVVDKRSMPGAGSTTPPNDISVLVLEKPVDSAHAKPMAIATAEDVKNAKWCTLVGYGNSIFNVSTGNASGFGTRRTSPVPIMPGSMKNAQVAQAYGCHFEFEFATGNNMLGQASCFGDSGGPVYVTTADNKIKVAGAVSRGFRSDITGPEVCGVGAINTLIAKYPDLMKAPTEGPDVDEPDPSNPSGVVHNLRVNRYHTVPLTNEDADRILADATTAIRTKDSPSDVACEVTLKRQGDVTTYNVGDGTIDSAFELNQALAQAGWIKVVREINYCGGPGSSIIGCAPVPGSSLVVVRFSPNQEGILWLHEFGHNKGLSHRNVANTVMRPFMGATHKEVNASECERFKSTAAPAQTREFSAAESDVDGELPVEEFVKRVYYHGVPWEEAAEYNSKKDVRKLIKMLKKEENEEYLSNIAATLALSGQKKAVQPLLKFVQQGEGELSDEEYRAKRTAVMMLGVLVNKTKDEDALNFLVATATQKESTPKFSWTIPGNSDAAYRQERMATMAIWGLSLSGQPKAITTLEALKQQTPTNFSNENGKAVIDEALQAAKTVAEVGAMKYHAQPTVKE